jgi:hypothetical protein
VDAQGDLWLWPVDGTNELSETWVATVGGLGYRIIK